MEDERPKRQTSQFGIRELLLWTTVIAGLMAGLRIIRFGNPDAKYERRLAPAIEWVEDYVASKGRLPSQREFQDWADSINAHMLILRDRDNEYAAMQGAKTETDFMVGTWRADWYHYYKSWDGKYLNAMDEPR